MRINLSDVLKTGISTEELITYCTLRTNIYPFCMTAVSREDYNV